jgi:hypothetical protein
MRTNYFGSVYPAFYALPHLRESKGHIAVTSSVVSKLIVFGMKIGAVSHFISLHFIFVKFPFYSVSCFPC